ncbi:MAG: DUF1254 domain-containing protein [Solirubrobacteraceae bacterium]
MTTDVPEASIQERVQAAAQAYIYGYPLVYALDEMAALVAGGGRFPMQAPYNEFGHARELADADFAFVSPNNDTVYSIAVCDLRQGPLVLHVPDTAGRYYVLQFVDAWTNNFAYIGHRATGTADGEFLLAGPRFDGEVPDGMRVVHAPTGVFVIVGRTQVDGEHDLPAVHALQDQFTLTRLRVQEGGAAPGPVAGVPQPDARVAPELEWWERFRLTLDAFPPPEADTPFLAVCEKLGLTAPESLYVDPDPELAQVLIEGAKAGQAKIEELMQNVHASPTGWQSAVHLFDYNLDYYEIGTIDAPEWKIADRTTAYVTRAIAARAGLFGNHGYEANYEIVWVDGDGQPLNGANSYTLRLETPPPVEAFWSLTMYDADKFYLVANPINRYSIGDRTPGLKIADDGSVTLNIGKHPPGPDKASNWLPAPDGKFRPCLRMYGPRTEILDGTYTLPAINKVT